MSIGQRLYCLRKEKNLSQEELAELLSVSRQSISKWETDASVPELDKLIKLSEVFDISIDCLIRSEATENLENCVPPQTMPLSVPREIPIPLVSERQELGKTQKIVGVVLIAIGILLWLIGLFLAALGEGMLYSCPFLACGMICLSFRRRAWLWCMWAVYVLLDLYLVFFTSFQKLRYTQAILFYEEYNPKQLFFGILWMTVLYTIGALTLISFRKERPNNMAGSLFRIAIAEGIYLFVLRAVSYLMVDLHAHLKLDSIWLSDLRVLLSFVQEWTYYVTHTVILITVMTVWLVTREWKNDR